MNDHTGLLSPGRIGAVLALLASAACATRPAPDLTIAAASSLAPVVSSLVEGLRGERNLEVSVVLGASVDLAEQIRSGAPIDLFLSADPGLLETLEGEGLVSGEPVVFATGSLSIVLSEESRGLGAPTLDLLANPEIDVIVLADPDHAPFGAAAREALQNAGLWASLQDRLVYAGTARQALEVVETGNAQAGLIPTTLLTDSSLAAALVPSDLYAPPRYAGAAIAGSAGSGAAAEFLAALRSDRGRSVLVAAGLAPIDGP